MSTVLTRSLRSVVSRAGRGRRSTHSLLEGYGEHVFKGAVADKYLGRLGLPTGTIEKGEWIKDAAMADQVAQGVTNWATDNGASVFTHWFQPLAASGVRHGLTAQVNLSFFHFNSDGEPIYDLKGKDLLKGETDGSSYPNGGLRATHTAGGYLAIDPTSPIWLRGDTIFIPACFASYNGHALDEKTPLLRAQDALDKEGTRLLKHLGFNCSGVDTCIGLEQEFFLIPRDAFMKRPDLQMAGRTVLGKDAPRGQEMCDHYYGAFSSATPALACIQELQRQCYKLGIPLKTRHREVAPNQYETAPLFGSVTTQTDQNLIVMQILEEVAAQHGLAALIQEKPFNNINGSGKHNNWSVWTKDGTNLLNVEMLAKNSGNDQIFPVIMAALVSAVDKHGDLMRMAIASPGNDFRLGACEAPPAIVSAYLGTAMTEFLESYMKGNDKPYTAPPKVLDLGVKCLPPLSVPAEDRNRTSPFPYGGHRFEFRAVGSAQNVSLVNTVLSTITADAFREFSDAIESGKKPREVATKALETHWKAVFNGNNYDPEMQKMLTDKGVWRIDSGVDAIARFSDPKNVKLFESVKVFTGEECAARQSILLDHYVGTVEMEALACIDMINQHIIPSVKKAQHLLDKDYTGPQIAQLAKAAGTIKDAISKIHGTEDEKARADLARTLRLETMVDIRTICDEAEAVVPSEFWTLATYNDLLFLDTTAEN
eukprot:gnl/TRDRNA2_/TRDRNA2_177519_c0_seq1.p1 gnl/TRDRNA2_/TRDRNA2_177519_c0~~gnl/TRDRNA2_/TRDRNA2_177519_c0_seq1.p1  ORF type:complete len:709 (-),score=155.72 gnl/TRDRNA2_/TRDRNA2_177519_c0_seq1:198-2324(-)